MADPPASSKPAPAQARAHAQARANARAAAVLLLLAGLAELLFAVLAALLLAYGPILDPTWPMGLRLARSVVAAALVFGAAGAVGASSAITALGLWRGLPRAFAPGLVLGALAGLGGCPPVGLAVLWFLLQPETRASFRKPRSPDARTAG